MSQLPSLPARLIIDRDHDPPFSALRTSAVDELPHRFAELLSRLDSGFCIFGRDMRSAAIVAGSP